MEYYKYSLSQRKLQRFVIRICLNKNINFHFIMYDIGKISIQYTSKKSFGKMIFWCAYVQIRIGRAEDYFLETLKWVWSCFILFLLSLKYQDIALNICV